MTVIRVTSRPPEWRVAAEIFDGRSAALRSGMVRIDEAAPPALVWSRDIGAEVRLPLESLREVPDQAGRDRLVVTSTERPLLRLMIDADADADILRKRTPNLGKSPPVRGLGKVLTLAVAAVASVALILFVLVPVMADQLARVLPPGGERALGDATYDQIKTALGEDMLNVVPECTSVEGVASLQTMLERFSPDDLGLPYPITVTVLDHEMKNAFALPGGRVVFFRGLLDLAEDPDEIAAVMAHEIGHVAARDPTRIALRSAGSIGVLGLLFGDFAGGAVVLFLVERLIQADYTREAEAAADAFAVTLMSEAQISSAALGDLFERLLGDGGEPTGLAGHFMSHPALGDRIAAARDASLPEAQTRPALSPEAWDALRAICD